MLALCGNKSVEKILIFLLVNGKCYGTQLHRSLKTPLTPIQKALLRLEKGGIILSFFEGKTRVFQFNPAYPLLTELEQLLKKAYTLLPPQEKREYYVPKEESTRGKRPESKARTLFAFWEKLATVRQITFHAKSKSEEIGWNGTGKGEVVVGKEGPNVLTFTEKGTWKGNQGGETTFRNVFRWTLDRNAGMISLDHLRRGEENPVFLFYLAPTSSSSLSSVDSHLCEGDTYFGQIHFDRTSLRLNWRIIGSKKNEEIDYYYS
ncbi:MAG: winged helix-turn-helix domain-containing protein [Parachlamydia sp.]|nr:winged helix-turn-helix domain-containing protein [Parachlamydia sp.]